MVSNNILKYKNLLTKMAEDTEAEEKRRWSWSDPFSWFDGGSPFRGSKGSKSEESKPKSEESSKSSDSGAPVYSEPPTRTFKSLLGDYDMDDETTSETPKKGKRYVFMPYGMGMPGGGGPVIHLPGGFSARMPGFGGPMMSPVMFGGPESYEKTKKKGGSRTELKRLSSGSEVLVVKDEYGKVIDILDVGSSSPSAKSSVSSALSSSSAPAKSSKKVYSEADLAARKAAIDASVGASRRADKEIDAAIDAKDANRRAWGMYRIGRGFTVGGGSVAGLLASNYLRNKFNLDKRIGWGGARLMDTAGLVGGAMLGSLVSRTFRPKDLSVKDIVPR